MENQLKNGFEKIITTSNFSSKDINIKKNYLNEFIKKVFQIENQRIGNFQILVKL